MECYRCGETEDKHMGVAPCLEDDEILHRPLCASCDEDETLKFQDAGYVFQACYWRKKVTGQFDLSYIRSVCDGIGVKNYDSILTLEVCAFGGFDVDDINDDSGFILGKVSNVPVCYQIDLDCDCVTQEQFNNKAFNSVQEIIRQFLSDERLCSHPDTPKPKPKIRLKLSS